MSARGLPGVAPTLRIGSINLNGLFGSGHFVLAVQLFTNLSFDVVLLQEHHLTTSRAAPALNLFLAEGWTAFLSCASSTSSAAGVGILVRTALLSTGGVCVSDVVHSEGRLSKLRLQWSGHDFDLICAYFPASRPVDKKAFITNCLRPLVSPSRACVVGGDFNFVECIGSDRYCGGQLGHNLPHPDTSVASVWKQHFPNLVDSFRLRHPRQKTYTHLASNRLSAARLDRVYTSPDLTLFLSSAAVGHPAISDHRPVFTDLLGKQADRTGRGRRRVRLGFLDDPAMMADFQAWLDESLLMAPTVPRLLLLWWPEFKRQVLLRCLAGQAAARRLGAGAAAALAAAEALYAELDSTPAAPAPALLGRIAAARQQYHAAMRAARGDRSAGLVRRWLHNRERPSPGLSAQLRPPRLARLIPGVRSAGGRLLTTGPAMAARVARYWASISAAPAVDAVAQDAVLAAMAGGPQLAPDAADALGEAAVTETEVARAVRRGKPGKAPGLDGLPIEFYRRFRHQMVPLLARVFTAIGSLGDLPHGFHEGLLTLLHKSGDRADPANYRPITLLNSDYRLLSRVLVGRLRPLLFGLIDREQTAFIPGRQGGENIMFLQGLQPFLVSQHRSAVVVFCDFCKAYDTIDRGFLRRVLNTVGLGPGFLRWVDLLLTHSRSRANVNGFVSAAAPFCAGVRQGCPLAPLLYLFVGQALQRFLRSQHLGLAVKGRSFTALQYADDANVLLSSFSDVPAFLAAMATFAAASGQALNLDKTFLLPLGLPLPAPSSPWHGLRIVSSARCLGIDITSAGAGTLDWEATKSRLFDSFDRISRFPLTVFGRGMASSAYGASRILYQAEFAALPPMAVTQAIDQATARLVDRKLPPDGRSGFAGVSFPLLLGSPLDGGFGVLPWRRHLVARHAQWAVRLMTGDGDAPWEHVLRAALSVLHMRPTPLDLLLPADAAPALPPPFDRLHSALQALPAPDFLTDGPAPPSPGLWCWHAPLWGSPLFPGLAALAATPGARALQRVGILRLGNLMGISLAFHAPGAAGIFQRVWRRLLSSPVLDQLSTARDLVDSLAAALPPGWWAAAAGVVAATGTAFPHWEAAADVLLPCLGWTPAGGRPLAFPDFSVRVGTRLQLSDVFSMRAVRFEQFVGLAVAPSLPSQDAVPLLWRTLERLWRLRWENNAQEPYRRLVVNGLATGERVGGQPCTCGASPADRDHHYWTCPVASAVVAELTTGLRRWRPAGFSVVQRSAVWLVLPPQGVRQPLWDVVCLAVVAAMDFGRKLLYRRRAATASLRAGVPARAAARFWELLADYAMLHAPASWLGDSLCDQPFFTCTPVGHTVVSLPP